MAASGDLRQGSKKRLRVRMLRRLEKCFPRRDLDQFARVHDPDALGHAGNHPQIVGNQQDGHATVDLNLAQ